MKQKEDQTQSKYYRKYISKSDRAKANCSRGDWRLVNSYNIPIPRKIPNQKQRRKLAAQMN